MPDFLSCQYGKLRADSGVFSEQPGQRLPVVRDLQYMYQAVSSSRPAGTKQWHDECDCKRRVINRLAAGDGVIEWPGFGSGTDISIQLGKIPLAGGR